MFMIAGNYHIVTCVLNLVERALQLDYIELIIKQLH